MPGDGNGEPEPTAGNGEDCGVLVEAGPEGPLTAGNGELPPDGAAPETGGNGLCARAAPIGAASAANTIGTRSPRTITVNSLCRRRFYDQG